MQSRRQAFTLYSITEQCQQQSQSHNHITSRSPKRIRFKLHIIESQESTIEKKKKRTAHTFIHPKSQSLFFPSAAAAPTNAAWISRAASHSTHSGTTTHSPLKKTR